MNKLKIITIAAIIGILGSTTAAATCFGWRLVSQKSISVSERFCSYEKNGIRQNFIVNGFCPMQPPGC